MCVLPTWFNHTPLICGMFSDRPRPVITRHNETYSSLRSIQGLNYCKQTEEGPNQSSPGWNIQAAAAPKTFQNSHNEI